MDEFEKHIGRKYDLSHQIELEHRFRGHKKGGEWLEHYKWFTELDLSTIEFKFNVHEVGTIFNSKKILKSCTFSIGNYSMEAKDTELYFTHHFRSAASTEEQVKFKILKFLVKAQSRINKLEKDMFYNNDPLHHLEDAYMVIRILEDSNKCKCCCCKCKCK